jgi:hypothetical protein
MRSDIAAHIYLLGYFLFVSKYTEESQGMSREIAKKKFHYAQTCEWALSMERPFACLLNIQRVQPAFRMPDLVDQTSLAHADRAAQRAGTAEGQGQALTR